MIYYQDEAWWSTSAEIGKTWFKKWQRPEIRRSKSRSYRFISGAINPENGDLCSMVLSHLDKEMFGRFLDAFMKHLNLKNMLENNEVCLVVDKAAWHSTKDIELPEQLKIITLPTAAAQINPIERLWLYIRSSFTNCKTFKSLENLEETLVRSLQILKQMPEKLMSICKVHLLKNI